MEKSGTATVISLRDLARIANEMFPRLVAAGERLFGDKDGDWKSRSCGYLVFQKVGAESAMLVTIIGGEGGNYDRRFKYREYALEKAQRLEANREEGHLTSWESRNPDENQWGGAIFVRIGDEEYVISFSGIPELGDEIFCVLVIETLFPNDQQVARWCLAAMDRTENPLYEQLRAAVEAG